MTIAETKREPKVLNGVDTPTLLATVNAVRQSPELARFTWRASNRWVAGTHSVNRAGGFTGAGAEHSRAEAFRFSADHPAVLVGGDEGPTPVEFLLYALASCITAGVANIASARGVALTKLESRIEGDMDLRGILGLSQTVRNGYRGIRMHLDVEGDASPETLRSIVDQSRARSAVLDVLLNGTEVAIEVGAG